MKYLLLIGTFLLSCINHKKQRENFSFNQVNHNKNDTVCFDNIVKEFHKVKLIKYCHIVYNDSTAERRNIEYGNGKLPIGYNFEDQRMLATITQGDSFFVKIVFLSGIQGKDYIPDTIFFRNDTLFLREKGVNRVDKLSRMGRGSEAEYTFLIDNKKQVPYVYHLSYE